MSHAEYASRPIPVFSKLVVMLRNLPAVQFVVAKFANLLRSSKTGDETQLSQFAGDSALDKAPAASEAAADFAEIEAVGESTAPAPEAVGEIHVSQFVAEAPVDDTPGILETPAGLAESTAAGPSIAAAPEANHQSDREQLIRRRWAETGIKMWSGRSALNIQGRAGVLPAHPGETLPRYDTLEYRLIAGQIVCEGVVLDPPQPRK